MGSKRNFNWIENAQISGGTFNVAELFVALSCQICKTYGKIGLRFLKYIYTYILFNKKGDSSYN